MRAFFGLSICEFFSANVKTHKDVNSQISFVMFFGALPKDTPEVKRWPIHTTGNL